MFIITLTLTRKSTLATDFMAAHKEWISRYVDAGVFVLVGGLKPQGGGAILAVAPDIETVSAYVAEDPFVRVGIVNPHIQEVVPAIADNRLAFFKEQEQ